MSRNPLLLGLGAPRLAPLNAPATLPTATWAAHRHASRQPTAGCIGDRPPAGCRAAISRKPATFDCCCGGSASMARSRRNRRGATTIRGRHGTRLPRDRRGPLTCGRTVSLLAAILA